MTVTGTGPATGGGELTGAAQDTSPVPRRRAGQPQHPAERLVAVGAACWCVAAVGAGVGLAQPAVAAVLVAAPVAVSALTASTFMATITTLATIGVRRSGFAGIFSLFLEELTLGWFGDIYTPPG